MTIKKYSAENPAKDDVFPGWCATKVDMLGKVEEMGLCADKCQDLADGINFATVNLLTQDECEYILKMKQNEVNKTIQQGSKNEYTGEAQKKYYLIFYSTYK